MAIEAKDIFSALKLEPVETPEEFIAAIEKAGWIQEEQIFKDDKIGERIFGRAFGTSTTNVAKTFRKMGIEITGAELKNPIEKVVETGLQKLNDQWEAKKVEIEGNSKLTIDERVKAAEEAKSALSKKVLELEDLVKTKAHEFETQLSEKEKEVKTISLKTRKSEAERKLKFLPELDPYKKKGWLAEMDEKYRIETDTDGTHYPVNAADGSRIRSTQHAGTYLGIDELYEMEAAKAGIITIAPNGGKPAPVKTTTTQTPQTVQTAPRSTSPIAGRVVAPAAIVK